MSHSRTRSSAFPTSQSAPSSSSMRDSSDRRTKGRRAKELTCESCGKHPVCLQKHRWEHNPLWRDTAQLLLSKHQQVQVMEAAAILVHGTSLPPDRALWPSYMSGGTLPSPKFAGDGTTREQTPQLHRAASPTATVSSSARDDAPPTSQFDDDELEEVSEAEEDELVVDDEDEDVNEEAENTDDSDVPLPAPYPVDSGRGRSQPIGLAAPVSSHMPNFAGSYGVGASRMLPSSLALMPASSYGWGVITESGTHGAYGGPKSPISEPHSPVAINQLNHHSQHQHHRSISSFSSFTHSFGSSSTSSYIPSSSLRSGGDMDIREGDDGDEEDAMDIVRGVEMHHGNGGQEDDDSEAFDYTFERATTLCRRLTAVTVKNGSAGAGTSGSTGASTTITAAPPAPSRSRLDATTICMNWRWTWIDRSIIMHGQCPLLPPFLPPFPL